MSKRTEDDEQVSALARRPWFLITGGMIVIGAINLILGFWLFSDPTVEEEQEIPNFMPPLEDAAPIAPDAGVAPPPDAP